MFLYEQFEWDCVSSQSSSDYLTKEEECSVYTQYMIAQFIIIFLELYFLLVNSVVVGLALATCNQVQTHNSVIINQDSGKKEKHCHHLHCCLLLWLKPVAPCYYLYSLYKSRLFSYFHISLSLCMHIYLSLSRARAFFILCIPGRKMFKRKKEQQQSSSTSRNKAKNILHQEKFSPPDISLFKRKSSTKHGSCCLGNWHAFLVNCLIVKHLLKRSDETIWSDLASESCEFPCLLDRETGKKQQQQNTQETNLLGDSIFFFFESVI